MRCGLCQQNKCHYLDFKIETNVSFKNDNNHSIMLPCRTSIIIPPTSPSATITGIAKSYSNFNIAIDLISVSISRTLFSRQRVPITINFNMH